MGAWPVAPFPQKPQYKGTSGSYRETVVRNPTSSGHPLTRRRSSAVAEIIPTVWLFTTSELTIFKTFFETTADMGNAPVDIPHPVTGATISAKLRDMKWVADGYDLFKVSFTLEEVP